MSNQYTLSFPTLIHFGVGVRNKVSTYIKENNLSKPLIVTDRGVAQQEFFKDFVESLKKDGLAVTVFSEIFGNPVKSQVTEGNKSYKTSNSDSIIGIGGGAALDVSKAIALMVNHSGDLFDYEDGKEGALPVDKEIPLWVALPTTAGTGSEVGRSAVVSDDETHLKKIIFSPKLLAKAVFADPELTIGLPASITASTGMDALTHLVEAYLAKGYHPLCDGIALEGIHLVSQSLVQCVHNPKDLEARGSMLMASLMGAVAFQKGLGLTHSCAHALSTVADLHHGLANGVMIDFALKFNIDAVPERFQRIASTLGLENQSGEGFLNWVRALKKEIGIPMKLSDLKIGKEHIEKLVEVAINDGCHQSNPKVCTREDFGRIFSEAI